MLGSLFGFSDDEDDESIDKSRRKVLRTAATSGAALGMVGGGVASASAQEGIEVEQKDCDEIRGKQTLPARCIDGVGGDPIDVDDSGGGITSGCNEGTYGPCEGVTCCWTDCPSSCDAGDCVPKQETICHIPTFLGCTYNRVCNCRCR